jgi:hypothetical protein
MKDAEIFTASWEVTNSLRAALENKIISIIGRDEFYGIEWIHRPNEAVSIEITNPSRALSPGMRREILDLGFANLHIKNAGKTQRYKIIRGKEHKYEGYW